MCQSLLEMTGGEGTDQGLALFLLCILLRSKRPRINTNSFGVQHRERCIRVGHWSFFTIKCKKKKNPNFMIPSEIFKA